MNLIRTVLDWETAYGVHPETGENITLSKMTTEEYVRHPRFKVHCLGVKLNQEPPFCLTGTGDLLHFLKTHPWGKSFVIGHHTHFDGAILSWRCGIRPAFWGCTMSMFRALYPWEAAGLGNMSKVLGTGEKGFELVNSKDKWQLTPHEMKALAGYCALNEDSDVNLTSRAFDLMSPRLPTAELRLIDLNTRLFTEPTLVVEPRVLLEDFRREGKRKRALLKQCNSTKETLGSNDQFALLLLAVGVDPPKKISPSKLKDGRVDPDKVGEPPTGRLPLFKALARSAVEFKLGQPVSKEQYEKYKLWNSESKNSYPWAYAFGKSDEEFIQLLEHEDEMVRAIVEARLGVKSTLKETRSKRFYKIGKRGAFPVYHKYYGAKSGRDSGGDRQNTTNLNRVNPKDPTSGALRKSLLAPPGHVLVVRDLSMIECVKLAYYAGQEDLLDLFRAGGDPYNRQATMVYGYEVNRKDPKFVLEGMAGKALVLGCGYGLGWGKFQASLRAGFMGMPSIMFNEEQALRVGADINAFCARRSYRKGCANLADEAMLMKPLNVGEEDHLWHCCAVHEMVGKYRESNDAVVRSWKEAQNALPYIAAGQEITLGFRPLVRTCVEGLLLPNGMKIYYHQLKLSESSKEWRYLSNRKKKEYSYLYGGKMVENIIQSLARVVMTDQMLRCQDWLRAEQQKDPKRYYKIVTSTYDEIVECVPEDRAEEALYVMEREMSTPPSWCPDLPLKSSGGYARSYGDCK